MSLHLIEVEERRLDLRAACTSMFESCKRKLGWWLERRSGRSRRCWRGSLRSRTFHRPASAELEAKLSRAPRTRAVPAATRREVFERDGEQCTFVSDDGARCPSRGHLELDHIEPRALGGGNAASNLRVRCRAHNRLYAEQVFGKAHIAQRVDFRRRSGFIPSRRRQSVVP